MSLLSQATIFLASAAVAVTLSKRLGLGTVLGYLVAGVLIGPYGLGLIGEVESVLHFAEFGVVLLLFLIGLELQPSRLWELRRAVFRLGSAQVLLTSAALAAVGMLLGLAPAAAIVAGLGLSLSSTAFALQMLAEKNQLASDHGQASFGILLFQDLAVIPMLAILPLLGDGERGAFSWQPALAAVGVLGAVVLGGRYVLRPVFRWVASTHSQEIFTATALLVVTGTALLVNRVGLSMALGAFLAGVLLADSEYRHELEADLEPFKGLLLGLFFIAVGMSVHTGLILQRPVLVASLVVTLMSVKALVLYGLGRWRLGANAPSITLALTISQGGEFAFVLFGLATGHRILDTATSDLLIVVVTLSMAVTPILLMLHERFIAPRLARVASRDFDVSATDDNPVLIAGFGRVGQVVARVLRAKHIGFTAMDANPEHIDFIKRFGNKVFYGDASRLDLLRAARADRAKVFVLAIDDIEASMRTAAVVQQHFPHVTIFARARNRQHAYRLMDLGIKHIMRETFSGSLELTGGVLEELGLTYSDSRATLERFREHDEALLESSFAFRKDDQKLNQLAGQAREELESLFQKDAADRAQR